MEMNWFIGILVHWVVQAAVTMIAVRVVTPDNSRNTLARALAVTLVVAVVLTPLTWLAILILPLIVAAILWFAIFMMAYGLGPLQAFGVGLMQVLVGWGVSLLLGLVMASVSGAPVQ